MNSPIVSVIIITYAHEKFIEQAINGVLMQVCNFDVELIIANDNSPDNTNYVVEKAIQQNSSSINVKYIKRDKNIGMMSNLIDAINQSSGKYIAMCEGDDYWTDNLKLKKQVQFLETNQNFVFCTHRFKIYSEFRKEFNSEIQPPKFEPYNQLLKGVVVNKKIFHSNWMTQPLTVLIKRDAWNNVAKESNKFEYFRDFHFFYLLLNFGEGFCMDFIGGVYRKHEGGIYSGTTDISKYKTALIIYEELYLHTKDKRFFATYWNAVLILLKHKQHRKLVLNSFFVNLTFTDKLKSFKYLFTSFNNLLSKKRLKN